jgi:hypothetical protein
MLTSCNCWCRIISKKAVNIRLAIILEGPKSWVVDQLGISAGFGLKLNKLKFNYSYSRYTLAGNTSLFGLTINFNILDKNYY